MATPSSLSGGSVGAVDRITTNPAQCGGRPCVRGMRIRVTDVLDLLGEGLSPSEILDELPDLDAEDVRACVQFARRRVDHAEEIAADVKAYVGSVAAPLGKGPKRP